MGSVAREYEAVGRSVGSILLGVLIAFVLARVLVMASVLVDNFREDMYFFCMLFGLFVAYRIINGEN